MMKNLSLTILFLSLVAVPPISCNAQERIWKDSTGKFEVKAELLDVEDGKVVLKKAAGNIIRVPISRLSAADQEYLKERNQPAASPDPSSPSTPNMSPPAAEPNNPGSVAEPPPSPNESDSSVESLLKAATKTKPEVLRTLILDASHFDLTDLPPRPKRAPQQPIAKVQDPENQFPKESRVPIEKPTIPAISEPTRISDVNSKVDSGNLNSESAGMKDDPIRREVASGELPGSDANRTPDRELPPVQPESPPSNDSVATNPSNDPALEPKDEVANRLPSAESMPSVSKTGADQYTNRRNEQSAEITLPKINVTRDRINAIGLKYRPLAIVLYDQDNPEAMRQALSLLGESWPADATILDLVRQTSTFDDKFCRLKSLLILGEKDPVESLPFILARMDDNSFEVRWSALNILEKLGDKRALAPLVDRFMGQERAKISSVLMAYGSEAEPLLFKYLKHRRADVRMETSLLLGKLGTEASIPLLEELTQNDPNAIVSLQAKSAIKNIRKRTEPDQ